MLGDRLRRVGYPSGALEGSGFGSGHRLDIWFISFITNKTTEEDTLTATPEVKAECGITAGGGNVSLYQLTGHFLVPFNEGGGKKNKTNKQKTVPFQAK